ncbi:MAG: T9SS type A sorting domain-containing protein, partial [Chitinophagales bacterium]
MKTLENYTFTSLNKFPIYILLLTVCCQLPTAKCYSQAPEIEWQNTIGGDWEDFYRCMALTSDGGFIIGGASFSNISGDKSEHKVGGCDYWVLKLNSIGSVEWQNTIGGNGIEYLESIIQTSDGGYLLGGASDSGLGGDKTEPKMGEYDYWLVKLTSTGTIQWQNTIGGSDDDWLFSVIETNDNGFLLGGYSSSGISSDKTEANIGEEDYWIVKINSTGVIEWQNTIGGTDRDKCFEVNKTSDGGYIVGGFSQSNISTDKSENNIGSDDYWIIKINSSGDIEWENTIGGSGSDQLFDINQTTDGGYIVGGSSKSDVSGDKTEDQFGTYNLLTDYWILKLNSVGVIEWQNTIGGSSYDNCSTARQTSDGGYIIGGDSKSGISGDKTEICRGENDYWTVKLNNLGDIEWQKTLGGDDFDITGWAFETLDGGFVIAGGSKSNISGDKTENTAGDTDYWIVKLVGDACAMATGLFTDNITQTKATVHWNLIPGADSYQIWYREVGAGTWLKKSSITNFKTIKLLTPDTDYEYKVRSKCSDGSFTDFSPLQYFTTLPLRAGEFSEGINLIIYPNPASEIITIETNTTCEQTIQLLDATGKLIQNMITSDEMINMQIGNLPSGIYFIKVGNETNT